MGQIWWRCIACGLVQAGPGAQPPAPIPAVMQPSQGLASACQSAPAHQAQQTGAVVAMNPHAGGMHVGSPPPAAAPAVSYGSPVAPHPAPAAPAQISGCCVCGSDEVGFVLESTTGLDAANLAQGHTIRAGFCSTECIAKKLGLVVPNGGLHPNDVG